MKKTYIVPQICNIYAERLLSVDDQNFDKVSGGDVQEETGAGGNGSKMSNVTVWDDEDDNWGFSGF